MTLSLSTLSLLLLAFPTSLFADTWPQWLGPQRDDVWRETGIVERFSTNGPPVLWRVAINPSYCGPSVVGDRLYVLDRPPVTISEQKSNETNNTALTTNSPPPANERVLCLDARTGQKEWDYTYPSVYHIGYPEGPRATPVVAEGRVYTQGAMGELLCLDARNGKLIWERNFPRDYSLAKPPVWGWSSHPLLDGERLICLVGGTNSAVVAFNKDTGKEIWRALTAVEIGYAPPVIYAINGHRQLIIWHPDAVSGLEPETGKLLWSQPYPVDGKPQRPEVTIAMPRLDGDRLFLTCFYHGSIMLQLLDDHARLAWNRSSTNDDEMNDGLHTVLGTPLIKGGFIYGVCGYGELRCLDAKTGDRKWETYAATAGKKAFFANAFITVNRDREFLWNDQGELIMARLQPSGYEEICRAKLLDPLEKTRGRIVTWCHPAYANRCIYVHNGKELLCATLAADQQAPRAHAASQHGS